MHGDSTRNAPCAVHCKRESHVAVKDESVGCVHAIRQQCREARAGNDGSKDTRNATCGCFQERDGATPTERNQKPGKSGRRIGDNDDHRGGASASEVVEQEKGTHLVVRHRVVRCDGQVRRVALDKCACDGESVFAVLLQRSDSHGNAASNGQRVISRVVPVAPVKIDCVDTTKWMRLVTVGVRVSVLHVHVVVGCLGIEACDGVAEGTAGRVWGGGVHVTQPSTPRAKAVQNRTPTTARALLVEEPPDGARPCVARDDIVCTHAVLFRNKRKDHRIRPRKRRRLRQRAQNFNVVRTSLARIKRGGSTWH
eukprot:Opistho-2@30047